MKIIAHRPFRDEHPMERFDPSCLADFDGLELDLRSIADGEVTVLHGAIVTRSRRPANGAAKPLEGVIERISAGSAPVDLVFLDVKSSQAARQARRARELLPATAEVSFICWHEDDVRILNETFPDAGKFYGIAPIWENRLNRHFPEDFFVFNTFPYFAGARRFRPRARQFNQHNIYVGRLGAARMASRLPEGVTGLCFHKVFFKSEIAALARQEGLRVAVYGFRSLRDPKIEQLAKLIDYAIVDPDLGPGQASKTVRTARVLGRRVTRRVRRLMPRRA